MPVEEKRILHILVQVAPTVPARPQREFMGESSRLQLLMEQLRALFESVTVLVTAIEIELQVREAFRVRSERQGAVQVPIGSIQG